MLLTLKSLQPRLAVLLLLVVAGIWPQAYGLGTVVVEAKLREAKVVAARNRQGNVTRSPCLHPGGPDCQHRGSPAANQAVDVQSVRRMLRLQEEMALDSPDGIITEAKKVSDKTAGIITKGKLQKVDPTAVWVQKVVWVACGIMTIIVIIWAYATLLWRRYFSLQKVKAYLTDDALERTNHPETDDEYDLEISEPIQPNVSKDSFLLTRSTSK